MSTANEVALLPVKAPPLPALTEELTPVQKGWLQMSHNRNVTVQQLEKGELEVQALIKDIATVKDLPKVQEALKQAKSVAAEAKEKRLYFTNALKTKLIDKLMEFESRNEALIADAAKHELALRIEAAKKAQADAAKLRETEQYKAHIKNEYARVAATYALALEGRINFYYKQALQEKKKNKVVLAEYLKMIKEELPNIEKVKANKFERAYVTNDEAKAIIGEIDVPDYGMYLVAAQDLVDKKFQMYDEDMKNAEAAIAAQKIQEQQKEAQVQSQLTQDAALNNLVASSDSFVIGGPKTATVKKNMVIVEENTTEWGLAVMTAFITNLSECQEKLLVKTWAKLTLAQMAAALTKVANGYTPVKQFPNLKMTEVIK